MKRVDFSLSIVISEIVGAFWCRLWHRRAVRQLLWLPVGLMLLWPGAPAASCPPPVPRPSAEQLQAAQRQDRGLLWTLQRDGRTSYLYGTLHVGRPEWMTPGPRVAAALDRSELLALEIDPTNADMQREMAAPAGPEAPALPAALKERLARQIAAACLPAGALDGMHPAMQAMLLGVLEARWAGLDPGFAQEQALARRALDAGHRIVSLESVALQKKALLPDSPAETLAMVEQTLSQLESGSERAAVARLAQVWAQGDLATLEDYERWCDCIHDDAERAAMRALNDERNPALAERIDALHREGRPLFAAVGALHMTGAQSLLRHLAARGFRIQHIEFRL
jgi:uncharacterized protein YbaP (TraB family)